MTPSSPVPGSDQLSAGIVISGTGGRDNEKEVAEKHRASSPGNDGFFRKHLPDQASRRDSANWKGRCGSPFEISPHSLFLSFIILFPLGLIQYPAPLPGQN